jgi:hypothetical protein
MTQNQINSAVSWGKSHYTSTQRKVMFELHKLGLDMVDLHSLEKEIAEFVGEVEAQADEQIRQIADNVKSHKFVSKYHAEA